MASKQHKIDQSNMTDIDEMLFMTLVLFPFPNSSQKYTI